MPQFFLSNTIQEPSVYLAYKEKMQVSHKYLALLCKCKEQNLVFPSKSSSNIFAMKLNLRGINITYNLVRYKVYVPNLSLLFKFLVQSHIPKPFPSYILLIIKHLPSYSLLYPHWTLR